MVSSKRLRICSPDHDVHKNGSFQRKLECHEFCVTLEEHSCGPGCHKYYCHCGGGHPARFSKELLRRFLEHVQGDQGQRIYNISALLFARLLAGFSALPKTRLMVSLDSVVVARVFSRLLVSQIDLRALEVKRGTVS